MKVKICGITSVEDALAAVNAGADALGFMFYEPSPRFVTPDCAARICRELPPFVAKVGVFVDASEAAVCETMERCGLDALQFHGGEEPAYCRRFGKTVIKAFRVQDENSLKQMEPFEHEAWLLDAYVAGQLGGTGRAFNWELARQAAQRHWPIILAGGLTPENIGRAVGEVGPFAVDVSSGVESAPGKKDRSKMEAFIAAAKSTSFQPEGKPRNLT